MEHEKTNTQLDVLQKFEYARTPVMAAAMHTVEMIALRPCVENLGLNWSGQLQAIRRNPVLNELCVSVKAIGTDGKKYDMICLPYHEFQNWLWNLKPTPKMNVELWEEYKKGLVVYLLMMLKMSMDKIEDLQHSDTALSRLKDLHAKKKEIERQEKEIRHDLKELAKTKALIEEEIDELMGEPSTQMELEFVTK